MAVLCILCLRGRHPVFNRRHDRFVGWKTGCDRRAENRLRRWRTGPVFHYVIVQTVSTDPLENLLYCSFRELDDGVQRVSSSWQRPLKAKISNEVYHTFSSPCISNFLEIVEYQWFLTSFSDLTRFAGVNIVCPRRYRHMKLLLTVLQYFSQSVTTFQVQGTN